MEIWLKMNLDNVMFLTKHNDKREPWSEGMSNLRLSGVEKSGSPISIQSLFS